MIENMCFDVMHSKYLFHWPAEVFPLEKASVRVMPEPDPQVAHYMLLFQLLKHAKR